MVETLGVNFDVDPNDTRQYKTHAAWCRYLYSRGSLSPYHETCQHAFRCAAPDRYVVRQIQARHDV